VQQLIDFKSIIINFVKNPISSCGLGHVINIALWSVDVNLPVMNYDRVTQ